jgi:tRNA dimethylallyltransferase
LPPVHSSGDGRVVTVVGPTATGKSDLAVDVALRLTASTKKPVEIINADSMQLYRGMDIGTAKMAVAERRGVPHHLLDIWALDKSAAVAEYQALARAAIADIRSRGAMPLLVGGSGLYVRAAVDRLEFPGESSEIRARLNQELADVGPVQMHRQLAAVDPDAAAAILPSNGRRIVRALEVHELTGGPFLARMPGFDALYDTVHIGLDRTDLDERVDHRVQQMVERGLVAEVVRLCADGLRTSPTAGKALGYAQVLDVVDDAGVVHGDLDEAVAITQRATRRFVRRQRSWFRRDPRITWLDGAAGDRVEQALTLITG